VILYLFRSYHIFYFMITHVVDMRSFLSENIYDYPCVSMGKVSKSMKIEIGILNFLHAHTTSVGYFVSQNQLQM
jgi:hypothetical protein